MMSNLVKVKTSKVEERARVVTAGTGVNGLQSGKK